MKQGNTIARGFMGVTSRTPPLLVLLYFIFFRQDREGLSAGPRCCFASEIDAHFFLLPLGPHRFSAPPNIGKCLPPPAHREGVLSFLLWLHISPFKAAHVLPCRRSQARRWPESGPEEAALRWLPPTPSSYCGGVRVERGRVRRAATIALARVNHIGREGERERGEGRRERERILRSRY